MTTINDFINEIKELEKLDNVNKVIKHIFRTINNKLSNREFEWVDGCLETINMDEHGVDAILSFLTITLAAYPLLKNRDTYYYKAEQVFTERLGADKIPKLMVGLKKDSPNVMLLNKLLSENPEIDDALIKRKSSIPSPLNNFNTTVEYTSKNNPNEGLDFIFYSKLTNTSDDGLSDFQLTLCFENGNPHYHGGIFKDRQPEVIELLKMFIDTFE